MLSRREVMQVLAALTAAPALVGVPARAEAPAAGAGTAGTAATAAPEAAGGTDARAALPAPDTVIERIAFGSCNDQGRDQGFWSRIAAQQPQLLLMLGDNVYGDVSGAEMTELRSAYARLADEPGFRALVAKVPTLAVWDDHDYGTNDGGGDFPFRQQAQALFREFWRIPADSARATRDGIYDAAMFGPAGWRLQLILLDTRSFRSPLRPTDQRDAPGRERYLPDDDPEKTLLGEAQWMWLEEQLDRPAEVRIIASSIQVLAEGHGFERWGNLPAERERLFQMITATGAGGVVFLSGDRHFGGLYRRRAPLPYPLTEITSSSLNRPWRTAQERDPLQLGDIFAEANFGMLRLDWAAGQITLELCGATDGALARSTTVPLAELTL